MKTRKETPLSQAKHTEGPWKVKESLITNQDETITVVDLTGAMGGENTDADAHLIAAAPELLDRLKATVETLRDDFSLLQHSVDRQEFIESLDRAIAKASNGDTTEEK